EVPSHVDHSLTVCERLLTILPEGNARMGPDGLQQHGDGLCDGPVIAPHVKPAQEVQRVGDLDACGIKGRSVDGLHRIESSGCDRAVAIDLLQKNKKGLIAEREKGTAQRGKALELVIGPLDRRDGITERDDLFAIMERTPADKDMGYAPCLQSTDVGPCDVA